MKSNHDLIYSIDNQFTKYGIEFDKIVGYSKVGSPISGASENPIEYHAYVKLRKGDDDPFEGVGDCPHQALLDLFRILERFFNT